MQGLRTTTALSLCAALGACSPGMSAPGGADCPSGRCAGEGVPSTPTCTDADGDGYGTGCERGSDCDDADPTQTGHEVCDGMDNDCDGTLDEGATSACGSCDPYCDVDAAGVGNGGFDLEADENEGLGVDFEGALVLDSREIDTNIIWIANTAEGTVSKFSTRPPFEELGRYLTGPDGPAIEGVSRSGNDPSRTSVNGAGDVYVGNRGGNSVSRISVLGGECPDTNGDGVITTSTGSEFLPWGQDDCVLWNTELDDVTPSGLIRAVAAQDVDGLDGTRREYVWVGGWNDERVLKLDGRTGEVLVDTQSPVRTYGFALDARGNLWISDPGGDTGVLGRLDTSRCMDSASCDMETCEGEGEADSCAKQRIPFPTGRGYGITVDFQQRVWLGGTHMSRYDPMAPPGSRWSRADLLHMGDGVNVHGVAADGEGWVWGAANRNGIVRVDANDPTSWTVVEGTTDYVNKGMAVDSDGKIWSITRTDRAVVVTPGPTLDQASVNADVARSIVSPYTYSDMTGLQLRLATNPRGLYRRVLEGCAADGMSGATEWLTLEWDADIPSGTHIAFRARTADTREALADADWISVASAPPDAPPASVEAALQEASVEPGRFLEVEAVLSAERSSTMTVITPRLRAFQVARTCPPSLN